MTPEGNNVTEIQAVETHAKFVRVPDVGGFSIDSISFWKVNTVTTALGVGHVLSVYFKTGGFIDLPDIDEAQFTSLVYGEPF